MQKKYYVLFSVIIAVGIGLGIMYLEVWRDAGVGLPEDVTMTTAYGQEFTFQNLEPKVRIVEFFYAKCPDICPLTTQRMMHLKQMFEEEGVFGDKVQFISITIDPENDTEEALQKYMARYGLEQSDSWFFLRGTLEDTRKVADPFRFQFDDRGTDFIVHTSYSYLLDENNELIEKIPMGEAFDKERVFNRIMRLVK